MNLYYLYCRMVKKQKHVLKESRESLITKFKAKYPQYKFESRVILREWPRNYVSATGRERLRCLCPIHNNPLRLLLGLQKVGVGKNLAGSARALSVETMCDTAEMDVSNPLSWRKACAMGECSSCPDLVVEMEEVTDSINPFVEIVVRYENWLYVEKKLTCLKKTSRKLTTLYSWKESSDDRIVFCAM